MFFKKKKIASQKKKIQKTPYILGAFGVLSILFLGTFVVQAMNAIPFQIFEFAGGSGSILNFGNKEDENTLDENVYILVTGRGGGNHDAPNLTDTMILAGINSTQETITLLSLPRDLWVSYPSGRKGRINGVYENGLLGTPTEAMQGLAEVVTNITGKKIDHYVNIDFNGFIEIVDTLGGVEVTLEENFADYEYPDANRGYKTFILKKGTWNLDGEVALMYARSRHSTSDFDRSLRQQQIISSLREKVSNLGYFKNRKQIVELYDIFTEYVETDLALTDMVKLGLAVKGWEDPQTLSFNLNDSCYSNSPSCMPGGFIYTPNRALFGGASVLLTNGGTGTNPGLYPDIHQFADYIYESPDMYSKPKSIVIYNATSQGFLAQKLAEELRPYGFTIDYETGTQSMKEKEFENSILYYNGIESNDSTLTALKDFLNIQQIEKVDAPVFSGSGTTIEIILNDTNSF
ncbi:LCP family protein [Candidatus Gracilibacteria bacterium]|nr:LCP family protein [Candidatus Gracilibacteria bacterium]